ncbi:alpha-hydroxyketone-type quorum-sensing autoinducer synthase [Propionivibrio dicarboxylicus]|uniref:CAI-1 autoinducer synthase n=1 Tax=Propionivibrio dicarboxylicus TaxID=83767 RepID=A0A1G8I2P7_9RHOO|nr:alpha-hydroxyketone-type quorum-sensing autoinducer synthase [Propionivibrio dicarboxylicus]SDI12920.1 CAI-1 autoinducer synthase [Propionivibrio dicarboxylicus]
MDNSVTLIHSVQKSKAPRLPADIDLRVEKYYRQRVRDTWQGRNIMHGKAPAAADLVLTSNDYLSIARHPRILKAMVASMQHEGNGMLMSGVFLHGENPQLALEDRLARFMHAEAGVLCQSGYAANTGLIQSIAGEQSVVYADMMAHMSLWEGIRSAGAKAVPFHHNDVENLERQVLRNGPGIVVVDSVFSTSGSISPLREIAAICELNGCVFVVDESHSLGTHGPNGEGLVVAMDLTDKVHFRTASLAKAFAGRAGFVTCSEAFQEYFKFESFPAIFSSTLLPHDVAGIDATLFVIRQEAWRRQRLHDNAVRLRESLQSIGYNLNDSASQIVSLEAGPEENTLALRDALESRGIFGAPFIAPATPKNRSLIRFSVNAGLSDADIDRIVRVCWEIRDEIGVANWPSTRRLSRGVRLHDGSGALPAESPAKAKVVA